MSNGSKHHHLVSRGYQRFFANGEQICLIDKEALTFKTVGTHDAFAEKNFNSWITDNGWDDGLEDTWRNIESNVLPRVGWLLSGDDSFENRDAAKVLAALHFARSYSFRDAHERLGHVTVAEFSKVSAEDQEFLRLYLEDKGHVPDLGEIQRYVQERMNDLRANRVHFVERMVAAYNFALGHFRPLGIQLLKTRGRMGFVTCDTPLFFTDPLGFRVGVRGHLALGDATAIYMPLGRHVAMTFWQHEPEKDVFLGWDSVQRINMLMRRTAIRFLACDPRMDPAFLLSDRSLKSIDR